MAKPSSEIPEPQVEHANEDLLYHQGETPVEEVHERDPVSVAFLIPPDGLVKETLENAEEGSEGTFLASSKPQY